VKIANQPANEQERQRILEETRLLDTPPDPEFDTFTKLAAFICGTPMALITLVDRRRLWFKSRVGVDVTEISREPSFCSHVICQGDLLEVPDASLDERFFNHRFGEGSPVRFYAGAPLITPEGAAIGTLCVMDQVARTLTQPQREALVALSRQIIVQVQLRRTAAELTRVNEQLRRVEESSHSITEWLQNFLGDAIDLIQSVTPEGRITYVNPAWREALGYPDGEALPENVLKVVAPESLVYARSLFARLAQGERLPPIQIVFRARDGRRLEMEGNLSCRFEDGKAVLIRGIFRDVTLRREAERMLEVQSAKLRSQARLLELANDAILVCGLDGTIRYYNRGAEVLYGVPREEAIGQSVHTLLHLTYPMPLAAVEAQLLAQDRWDGEVVHTRRDGAQVTIASRWALVRDEKGEPSQVLQISRDVTARKQAEDELRRVTALQRAILDSAAYTIISTDVNGVVLTFNPAAEEQLGYRASDVVGRLAVTLLHDGAELDQRSRTLTRELGYKVAPGFEALVARARLGQPDENEWTYVREDGTRFPILLSVTALRDEQGNITGFLGIGHDITARKEVDRMKNEFISTVSHELRTPLTSIRGALGLLEGGVAGDLSADAREFVQIARDNSDRLIRLVNDILDLEKIEAGKLELKLARLEPARLVHKAIEGMRGFAAEMGVRVELDVHGSSRIEGDEDRLVQVLTNLLSNAVKFSPRGAGVRALVRSTALGRIRFSVVDSGPGIAPEHRRRLFQKFQQLDQSDRREKGGTGLGLAISKAIVHQHSGQIGVESVPGRGSEFWFELPAAHSGVHVSAAMVTGKHTVLVVEDDPMMLRLLMLQLRAEGYHVLGAGSLEKAEELLEEIRPAAMVLDVFLPDGNGLEFLQMLRQREELQELPVVVLSGGQPHTGTFSAPVLIDWLSKPFDEVRLRKALRRAVRRPGSPRALVVEDDPSFRTILASQLRSIGVEVEEAADGAEAISLAKSSQPDLIILDLAMPRVDGFAVVGALRQDKARTTPLIIYSGRDLSSQDKHELSLGMTHYLTKARTNESDFIESVRELLNGIMQEAPRTP